MRMIEKSEEPECTAKKGHDWFTLGIEDSSETVSRCNLCKTLRYVSKAGVVRYEVPERPD